MSIEGSHLWRENVGTLPAISRSGGAESPGPFARSRPFQVALSRLDNRPSSAQHDSAGVWGCAQYHSYACNLSLPHSLRPVRLRAPSA